MNYLLIRATIDRVGSLGLKNIVFPKFELINLRTMVFICDAPRLHVTDILEPSQKTDKLSQLLAK